MWVPAIYLISSTWTRHNSEVYFFDRTVPFFIDVDPEPDWNDRFLLFLRAPFPFLMRAMQRYCFLSVLMGESRSLDGRGKPKRASILIHLFSFLFSTGDISKRKTNARMVKGFLCWDSSLFEPRMRNPVLLGRSRSRARRVERERSSESPRTYAHDSVSRGFHRSRQSSPETCVRL